MMSIFNTHKAQQYTSKQADTETITNKNLATATSKTTYGLYGGMSAFLTGKNQNTTGSGNASNFQTNTNNLNQQNKNNNTSGSFSNTFKNANDKASKMSTNLSATLAKYAGAPQ